MFIDLLDICDKYLDAPKFNFCSIYMKGESHYEALLWPKRIRLQALVLAFFIDSDN